VEARLKMEACKFIMEPWRLKMESWRLKIKPWRVYRPVFADSHHIEDEFRS
jgi:hypothetical protein